MSPSSLTFSTNQNTNSNAQLVTIQNTGGSNLTVSNITFTGLFQNSGTGGCPAVLPFLLAPGGSCTYGVTFHPNTTGAFSGALGFVDTAPGSPHMVTLSGTGTAPVAYWTPTSYAFGNVFIGSGSPATSSILTLHNSGNGPLSVNLSTTGSDPTYFGVNSTTCSSICCQD